MELPVTGWPGSEGIFLLPSKDSSADPACSRAGAGGRQTLELGTPRRGPGGLRGGRRAGPGTDAGPARRPPRKPPGPLTGGPSSRVCRPPAPAREQAGSADESFEGRRKIPSELGHPVTGNSINHAQRARWGLSRAVTHFPKAFLDGSCFSRGFPALALGYSSRFHYKLCPIFLLSFPFYTACKMFSRGLQTSAGPITSARKEAPMTCPRCDGLLLATLPLVWSSSNYQPSPGDEPDLQAWGCMNCGNYLDAVILTHRSASHPLAEVSPEPLAA